MTKTTNFALPLLSPSQAQKHVTVNEALVRLDAVTQLRIIADDLDTPPQSAESGASYILPATAVGAWTGRVGQVAVWSNGGWIYLAPVAGWKAWHLTKATPLIYDGTAWISGATVLSFGGAVTKQEIIEFDHLVPTGMNFETDIKIPAGSLVLGVTGRVLSLISGTLTSWRTGVPSSNNRYGTGLGLNRGSYLLGLASSPVAYHDDTPLLVSAESGMFTGGEIRFALHLLSLTPPRVV